MPILQTLGDNYVKSSLEFTAKLGNVCVARQHTMGGKVGVCLAGN
jgi:hypothetical protein